HTRSSRDWSSDVCSSDLPDINQAETKRAMMKTANRVILLCDSTKFGHDSFMRFGEVTDFDVIVSDGGMSQELVKELEIKGIEVRSEEHTSELQSRENLVC